jgi:hypothetical protein
VSSAAALRISGYDRVIWKALMPSSYQRLCASILYQRRTAASSATPTSGHQRCVAGAIALGFGSTWRGPVALRSATTACNLDTHLGPPHREAGQLGFELLAASDSIDQRLARAAASFFGTGFVDFVGALGGIGKDEDLVARNLQKAAADGHGVFGAALLDAYDARLERCQQRRMARQDANDALSAGCHHHVNGIVGKNFTLGGDDLDTQRHAELTSSIAIRSGTAWSAASVMSF